MRTGDELAVAAAARLDCAAPSVGTAHRFWDVGRATNARVSVTSFVPDGYVIEVQSAPEGAPDAGKVRERGRNVGVALGSDVESTRSGLSAAVAGTRVRRTWWLRGSFSACSNRSLND